MNTELHFTDSFPAKIPATCIIGIGLTERLSFSRKLSTRSSFATYSSALQETRSVNAFWSRISAVMFAISLRAFSTAFMWYFCFGTAQSIMGKRGMNLTASNECLSPSGLIISFIDLSTVVVLFSFHF